MSNHLSPLDNKEIDDKRQSTLSTATEDQSTAAATPVPASINDKDIEADRTYDGEKLSSSGSQNQADAEAEKQGEELDRVESSMYPGPFKLLLILVSVGLAIFLVCLAREPPEIFHCIDRNVSRFRWI